MSWKQFAASLVQSLAWPTVVLILSIVLRKSLVDLILRLKRFKHKETELEFEEQVAKIEEAVAIPKAERAVASEFLTNLAAIAPRAAVMEAWAVLESLLYKKALALGKVEAKTKRGMFPEILKILLDKGIIDPREFRSIVEMRELRNSVAHADDIHIEPKVAKRFSDLAADLAKALR